MGEKTKLKAKKKKRKRKSEKEKAKKQSKAKAKKQKRKSKSEKAKAKKQKRESKSEKEKASFSGADFNDVRAARLACSPVSSSPFHLYFLGSSSEAALSVGQVALPPKFRVA